MARIQMRVFAVAVFGVGMWAVLNVPALAAYLFGVGGRVTEAQLELALQIYGFAALAATAGFAVLRSTSVLRALCAIPIAALLVWLVPSRLGLWLSESFRSVAVNLIFLGLLFAAAGAVSGWLVVTLFNRKRSHV